MKRVEFSPAAEADLTEILHHIAEDNPARANSYLEEIIAKAQAIGGRPQSFPLRDDISPGLRAAIHGRYLIFFRELPERIRIIRVLHGARDLSRIFE